MFHPTQTNHLLWAFEVGWFMINSILLLNIYLIERLGDRSKPYIILSLVIGTLNPAHGMVLWFAAGLQFLLKKDLKNRLKWAAFFVAAALCDTIVILSLTPPGEAEMRLSDIGGVAFYFVQMIGASFGSRDENTIVVLGALVILLAVVYVWKYWPLKAAEPLVRVSFVLTASSILCLLLFTKGRYQYGLQWALTQFHAAPLLVPLLAGLLLLILMSLDESFYAKWTKLLWPAAALTFIIASIFSALPYASSRANETQLRRAFGMHVSCNSGWSQYVVDSANITHSPYYHDLIMRSVPLMTHLCGAKEPHSARWLETLPSLYSDLMKREHAYEQPLRLLWDIYTTHIDLWRAFPVLDPNTPRNLLEWARNNARMGSVYDAQILKLHEPFFKDLSLFDQFLSPLSEAFSEASLVQCDGAVDTVNGAIPALTPLAISNRLTVEGWTVISAKDRTVPDEVFLTLSNSDQQLYIKVRRTPRPDVKKYLGHPGMPDPGFTAEIDVAKLHGKYALGLSRVYNGKLDHCRQFNIPLLITR
jgi:hypothetical protein